MGAMSKRSNVKGGGGCGSMSSSMTDDSETNVQVILRCRYVMKVKV